MNNPYKVLGVSPDATDEQIKAAYRELAKKYHPDNYTNSPLSDVAEEKMKEINEAYDEIQRIRQGGGTNNSYGSQGYDGRAYGTGSAQFAYVRNLINAGNAAQAENILNSTDPAQRNAEWYFLYGCVMVQKGWSFEALQNFQKACSMDPTNQEYRNALNAMQNQSSSFGSPFRTYQNGNSECSTCDICSSLLCADCLCECCGGDLIPCC